MVRSDIAEEVELGEDRIGNALRCGTLLDATRGDAAFGYALDEEVLDEEVLDEEVLGVKTLGEEATGETPVGATPAVETGAWFPTLADDEADATGWLAEKSFSGARNSPLVTSLVVAEHAIERHRHCDRHHCRPESSFYEGEDQAK